MHNRFYPDVIRARALDASMQSGLSESLEHICEQCHGQLSFDEPAIRTIISSLANQKCYPPSTFALYYELATALFDDQPDAAENLFTELAMEKPLDSGLKIMALGDCEISEHTARFQRMMNSDPTSEFDFLPPPKDMAIKFRTRFRNGFSLIERIIPELAAEIRALVSQVLMAVGDPDKQAEFDGGSSYAIWGALFLNASSHENDIAMAEVIAHETAHCLLYGLSVDESLVLNPDDEFFPSPLRQDDRPMDGIYHATFVSARMHWAMSRLVESGQLDTQDHKTAEQARLEDQVNFYDGHKTVAAHAQLTETGKQVMAGAKAYMDAACI